MLLQLVLICLCFSSNSCSKDKDLLSEYVINEDEQVIIYQYEIDESKRTIVIPQNFDWKEIPEDYANANWEITFTFDLNNEVIHLPSEVLLNFNGGSLTNGSITGNASAIFSNNREAILKDVNLSGDFKNEYIFPYWFGAVMDGKTDDRDIFVETLKQAKNIGSKLLVDQDIFLDVEELGAKSIFLDDNTWIEGANEDINIIINNLLSPAFYMALTKDITIKKITFLYDQTYDANWGWDNAMHEANLNQLKNYMITSHNVQFPSWNPWSRSPIAWRSIFSLEAAKNVLFENVTLKAKGETADKFILWGIKLKEQYNSNQTISSYDSPTGIPENITFKDFTLDGAIMGIQGVVNGFKTDGITSYRYSDVQSLDGSSIGGSGVGGLYWMPPPHLFYLNPDTSERHITENVDIVNTIDYGNYTGTSKVRGSAGYCNSLKLVEGVLNARVENYKSYRRDGVWDIGAVTNGVFKNIYSESTSEIFEPSWGFHNARFVEGTMTNCTFNDIVVKDNSEIAKIYPWNYPNGNSNTIDNLQIYVKEFIGTGPGPFGIFGSENTIINSTLNLEQHSSINDYASVIFHLDDILDSSSNNHYEVVVNGWRKIDEDPLKKKVRLIFARKVNPNSNYAKVTDVDNKFIAEQVNVNETDTWVRSEFISLGQGNQYLLNTSIPSGFSISRIEVNVLEELAEGTKASIGFSTTQKDNLAANILSAKSTTTNVFNDEAVLNESQNIYFFSNQDFKNTGEIKVTIELSRKSVSDW
ncbi:hypothetical protein [Maribacter forsetii]|uniref:hypothetical protein n=1 Tax=Maribacter forsetii TaxID=444515 RepID=UPI0012FCDA39|nr:hypothetical protein [Maribacter forsetii]